MLVQSSKSVIVNENTIEPPPFLDRPGFGLIDSDMRIELTPLKTKNTEIRFLSGNKIHFLTVLLATMRIYGSSFLPEIHTYFRAVDHLPEISYFTFGSSNRISPGECS